MTKSLRQEVFKRLELRYPGFEVQLQAADKVTAAAGTALNSAAPYIDAGYHHLQRIQGHAYSLRMEEYVPMMLGLAMCFFGGSYTMLIAVIETVRLLCWEDLRDSIVILKENYEVALEQNRKDNEVDANGNGVPDVQELSRGDLLNRKLELFVKTVDVNQMRNAARTLCAALFSVIAALRVRFARTLALAGSLVSLAKTYVPLEQVLTEVMPPEAQRWSSVLSDIILTSCCMTAALLLRSIMGTVHCSVRGSHLFVHHAIRLAKSKGLMTEDMTMKSPKAKGLMAMVAVMGFIWQATHSGGLPFPINVALLPLTVLEWVLEVVVNGLLFVVPAN